MSAYHSSRNCGAVAALPGSATVLWKKKSLGNTGSRWWGPKLACAAALAFLALICLTAPAPAATLAGGGEHSLGVKADGSVAAWGRNDIGQCNVPPNLGRVLAVSSSGDHSLALRADGTVAAWGRNDLGQCTVPPGLSVVSAVAAGTLHSLALRADGTVAAWGSDGSGQCSGSVGLANVTAVAAGNTHSLALKSDGTVVAWGDNNYGQGNVPVGLNLKVIFTGPGRSIAPIIFLLLGN